MRNDPDLADFKAMGKREQRRPCKVAISLEKVAKDDRQRVLAALEHDDEEIRRGVRLWLQKKGVTPPSNAALTYHRAKNCRCHG